MSLCATCWISGQLRRLLAALLPIIVLSAVARGDIAPAAPADVPSLEDLMRDLASAHFGAARVTPIGESHGGETINVLTLGRGADVEDRPAMLIVAGLDGDVPVTSRVAMHVAQRLLEAETDSEAGTILDRYTVHVAPIMNPDGLAAFQTDPRIEHRGNLRPVDDDRDGEVDEDGPEDINGDGLITMMRQLHPKGEYLPDPAEPRLMKKAESHKGEKPLFRLFVEGIDNDGDEEYNEDGPGFVDINRNFMHGYKEHDSGTGPYQLSEPESRGLIDFVLEHPRIGIVVVYGRHDNVVKTPKGDKKDETGRAPVDLHKDDVAIYKQLGEKYREMTEIKEVPDEAADGAFFAWAYAQHGVPSFAVRVWNRPEVKKKDDKKDETKKDDDKKEEDKAGEEATTDDKPEPAGPPQTEAPAPTDESAEAPEEVPTPPDPAVDDEAVPENIHDPELPPESTDEPAPAVKPADTEKAEAAPVEEPPKKEDESSNKDKDEKKKPEPADKEAAAWLKYSDEQRAGEGFIPWTAFTHPQLGEVEIGGFVPFFQTTPPEDLIDGIVENQLAFVVDLIERFPQVSFEPAKVQRLAQGVYEIRTALRNDGYFPTAMAMGRENRRVRPIVVTLDLPLEEILGGNRLERVWSLDGSGGRSELRWLVRGDAGTTVLITASSEKLGDVELEITLTDNTGDEGGDS